MRSLHFSKRELKVLRIADCVQGDDVGRHVRPTINTATGRSTNHPHPPLPILPGGIRPRSADGALADLFEEVVAFVVDEDEGGKVFDFDFPHSFHAEFRILDDFHGFDVILRKKRRRSAHRSEIKPTVLLAGVGD